MAFGLASFLGGASSFAGGVNRMREEDEQERLRNIIMQAQMAGQGFDPSSLGIGGDMSPDVMEMFKGTAEQVGRGREADIKYKQFQAGGGQSSLNRQNTYWSNLSKEFKTTKDKGVLMSTYERLQNAPSMYKPSSKLFDSRYGSIETTKERDDEKYLSERERRKRTKAELLPVEDVLAGKKADVTTKVHGAATLQPIEDVLKGQKIGLSMAEIGLEQKKITAVTEDDMTKKRKQTLNNLELQSQNIIKSRADIEDIDSERELRKLDKQIKEERLKLLQEPAIANRTSPKYVLEILEGIVNKTLGHEGTTRWWFDSYEKIQEWDMKMLEAIDLYRGGTEINDIPSKLSGTSATPTPAPTSTGSGNYDGYIKSGEATP